MPVDKDTILFVITLGNALASCILFVISWINRKQHTSLRAIRELEEKLQTKCDRLTQIEKEMVGRPKEADIIRLHERLDVQMGTVTSMLREMSLSIGELCGQVKQMNIRKD